MKKIGNKIRRTYPNSVFADKVDTIVDRINGNRTTPIEKLKKSMFINSDSNNKIISAINDAIDEKDVDLNVNSFRNPSVKAIAGKLNETSKHSESYKVEMPDDCEDVWEDATAEDKAAYEAELAKMNEQIEVTETIAPADEDIAEDLEFGE